MKISLQNDFEIFCKYKLTLSVDIGNLLAILTCLEQVISQIENLLAIVYKAEIGIKPFGPRDFL